MIIRILIGVIVASSLSSAALTQEGQSEAAPEVETQGAEPAAASEDMDLEGLSEEEVRAELLDTLFERLSKPETQDWEEVQNRINALWNQSGSDSMDLLSRRADRAMQAERYDVALLHLNDLVRLAPDYAEGWNKRATLYFVQGEYGRSLEDIARTLKLEPRHFGALAGLGVILDRSGDSEGALEAYRRAVRIHPNLPGAQDGIKKLEKEVDGRRL